MISEDIPDVHGDRFLLEKENGDLYNKGAWCQCHNATALRMGFWLGVMEEFTRNFTLSAMTIQLRTSEYLSCDWAAPFLLSRFSILRETFYCDCKEM
jgi:hypothetical protein